MIYKINEPVRIRIRVAEKRKSLTRNSSSTEYSATVSSSNPSRCSSPGPEKKKERIKKQNSLDINSKNNVSFTMYQNSLDIAENHNNLMSKNSIRIYKPNKPKRKRKPIKVFRLPQVTQGEEE